MAYSIVRQRVTKIQDHMMISEAYHGTQFFLGKQTAAKFHFAWFYYEAESIN